MNDYMKIIDSAPRNKNIVETLLRSYKVLREHRNIAVSISGGSDSDIIMHLTELMKPKDSNVKYVFFDTGLEYKATRRHLDSLIKRYGVFIESR